MPLPPGPRPAPCIPDHKIGLYLLNIHHEDGGSKAEFFLSRGFTIDDALSLIRVLLEHPTPDNFARVVQNGYVTKYVFEGPMSMPDGGSPQIRSVWKLIENGLMMSLVTAYAI